MKHCFEEEMCMDTQYPCEEMAMGKHGMPENIMLAHAYVPWQRYEEAFNPKEALMKGTLFPELYGVYPIPR